MNYSNPEVSVKISIDDSIVHFRYQFPANKDEFQISKEDLRVWLFQQIWGSTALGFGGVGGCAMTRADTIIIECNNSFRIYFNGRFAYQINNPNKVFHEDLSHFTMAPVRESFKYHK